MAFYAIYETASGRLRSLGSIKADPLPAGLTAADITNPPADNTMWDETTRAFVARSAKVLVDRLVELRTHPKFQAIWDGAKLSDKNEMTVFFIELLGSERFRNQSSTFGIK